MEFIIAETWNGEGYTYLNKAYIFTADSKAKAQAYIISLLTAMLAESNSGDETIDITEGHIGYDDGIDQGSFQWMHKEDVYGVEILCNVNEVIAHKTKEDYESAIAYALDLADHSESEGIEDEDSPFIGSHSDDYDRQFVRF